MSDDGVWVKVWPEYVAVGEAKISAITGSGRLTTDGDSTVIEWLSDGSVTVSDEGVIPEMLLVAGGGGGGGGFYGGGAGAGGHIEPTSYNFLAGNYDVIVGAGGFGGNAGTVPATNGRPSTIGWLAAIGGGKGGDYNAGQEGNPGGSGGGGNASGGAAGGEGSFIQGSDGGKGWATNAGGGGGGASQVGVDAVSTIGGNGGDGKGSSITGSLVTRAGGGGGGCGQTIGLGGAGGGGNGSQNNADNGVTSLGGGGGGSSSIGGVGGDGGAGIIIFRLLTANTAGMNTSGFTIVTATMLAEQEEQRQAEAELRQAEAEAAKAEKKAARKSKANELKESKEGDPA